MTKYYLQNHSAIPLFSNGSVKSGDVIKLPDEATRVSRDTCYSLPPVVYHDLSKEFIQTQNAIAAEFGAKIPYEKVVQIEAEMGGKFQQNASILLDPFNQEEPPGGYQVLANPKPVPVCQVLHDIQQGSSADLIQVTRVFHGSQSAVSAIDLGGNLKVSAGITLPKIKAILGGTPELDLSVNRSTAVLQYSKSPDPLSLAAQSAIIDPKQLAYIYLRFKESDKYSLEVHVIEYITGSEPSFLEKTKLLIDIALKEMGLRKELTQQLYSSVFSGKEAVRSDEAIPA